MNLTPNHVLTLLHVYAFAEPIPRNDAPAVQTALTELYIEGILAPVGTEICPSGYRLTDRGNYLVKMILHTPLPIAKWVDPREENSHDDFGL